MSCKVLPKYVKDLLDQVSMENGFKDYSIQVNQGSQVGDGFTTELLSVKISENEKGKSLDLVCKMAPEKINRQKEFNVDVLFEREIAFYQNVMPCFAKFQEEKGLSTEDQFLAYPKCYAALANDEKAQYVIILEDLRPQGYKLWDKAQASPIENVRLAMRELGKFHGISIAMKNQRPKAFAEFQKLTDILRSMSRAPTLNGWFQSSLDRAINVLKIDEDKNIMRDLKKNMNSYFDSCLGEEACNRFGVVSHGDFWGNNMLFIFNEKETAESVRFLDWQVIRYGSPAIDILYNIYTSTSKELRDKEYDNLLRLYYNSLSKTVQLLGSDPSELFTFDNLKIELKLCAVYALLWAPIILEISHAASKEISNLDEIFDKVADGESQLELVNGLSEKA